MTHDEYKSYKAQVADAEWKALDQVAQQAYQKGVARGRLEHGMKIAHAQRTGYNTSGDGPEFQDLLNILVWLSLMSCEVTVHNGVIIAPDGQSWDIKPFIQGS